MPGPYWWGSRFLKISKNENSKKKNWNFDFLRRGKRKRLWDEEALYESPVRKLGWRFTARLPYWCKMSPVPNRPSLFVTCACFEMFLLIKTIIWNSTTFKINFVYQRFIFGEYEHLVIMQMRFPSGFKFSTVGNFLRFSRKNWNLQIFEIIQIQKSFR